MVAERQQDGQPDPWWGEHVHRYEEASRRLRETSTVLDLACGLGFGTAILSSATRGTVCGCDRSPEAVRQAHARYRGPRTLFSIAEGTRLPFRRDQFEAVISFETLEHMQDDRAFLGELRRVLAPQGILMLSTPNRRVSSSIGQPANPYHAREYTAPELEALLGGMFREVRLHGQKFTRFAQGRSGGRLGLIVETTLYARGVRRLPLFLRDRVSQFVVGRPHYPTPLDFQLVDDATDIGACRTLFAICRK